MFASVVMDLSAPNMSIHQPSKRLNDQFDKNDDVIVCNNYIGGHKTIGHIFPKPLSETTQLMFPKRTETARKRRDPTEKGTWANQTVVEMDRCCMEVLAYTYVWDEIVNNCISNNNITPCVYHMVYLMMKVMSRSPRIPPGTVLYRGSSTPFDQYTKNMRFMSFTTNIHVAKMFARNGYIGSYTVKPTDYLHGLWLDRKHGTSNFSEKEVVLGPGVYIDSVDFTNNSIDSIVPNNSIVPDNSIVPNNSIVLDNSIVPEYVQVYSLELKQQDVGTYFMDNYIPDADEHFRSVVESGCVLFSIKRSKQCLLDSFHCTVFKDWSKTKCCSPMEGIDSPICGHMYLSIMTNETMTIGLSDEVISDPDSAALLTNGKVYVYKVLNNDEVTYCTLGGLLWLAFKGNNIVVLPLGQITAGTKAVDKRNM